MRRTPERDGVRHPPSLNANDELMTQDTLVLDEVSEVVIAEAAQNCGHRSRPAVQARGHSRGRPAHGATE